MTLQALDPDNISYIAFWNAFDDGGATDESYTPADAEGYLDTYQEAGNGIEGTKEVSRDSSNPRTVMVRVKDDGWIISWINRDEDLESSNPYGPFDLLNDWGDDGSGANKTQHTLERVVKGVRDAIDSGGGWDYNTEDVGLYGYHLPEEATTLTIGSYSNSWSATVDRDWDTTITEGTTVHEYYVSCFASGDLSTANHDHNGKSIDMRYSVVDSMYHGIPEEGKTINNYITIGSYEDVGIHEQIVWS